MGRSSKKFHWTKTLLLPSLKLAPCEHPPNPNFLPCVFLHLICLDAVYNSFLQAHGSPVIANRPVRMPASQNFQPQSLNSNRADSSSTKTRGQNSYIAGCYQLNRDREPDLRSPGCMWLMACRFTACTILLPIAMSSELCGWQHSTLEIHISCNECVSFHSENQGLTGPVHTLPT